jgi:RND superfamily putative drug exporter
VLYRLAGVCVRRRVVVLVIWAVVTIVLVALSQTLGERTSDNLSLPGTDSQQATDALQHSFPDQANGTSPIVLHASSGKLTDSKDSAAVDQAAAAVAKAPYVSSVVNPLTPAGAAALSRDKTTGYLSVTLSVSPGELSKDQAQAIIDAAAQPAQAAGLEVQTGGALGQKVSKPSTESSELVGILVAMVILTLTFGTLTAMAIPIVTAIFALLCTLSTISLLSHTVTVPTIAPTLATMIGLGVGIDYALFIVTRYRRELDARQPESEAIARATATSGGAVFFAGGTVAIALISLAVAGIPLITTMGLMAAIAVLIAVLAALTLLPAELKLLGHRIDSHRVRHTPSESEARHGLWARWAKAVTRRPLIAGLIALAILIPLMIPTLSMTLGAPDTSQLPESTTARQAYDLISKYFGPGVNGPLLIAVTLGSPAQPATGGGSSAGGTTAATGAQTDPRTSDPRLVSLVKAISSTNGVAQVGAVQLDKAGTTGFLNATSRWGPADQSTTTLVDKLRSDSIPQAEKGTNMKAHVGGTTAGYEDLAALISSKLPLQIIVVIALSFVLLIIAFRTLVVPPQAAVMNLLSIAASYGVMVAVFQYGWLTDVIGLTGSVLIVSYVPLFMFAILFGLSMDYEVFLVSQIQEHHLGGENNTSAVGSGLITSARVITAAAATMVAVFGSFVLNGDPTVKQFGVGLAVAVVLDATVVRCLLVPAVMVLFAEHNWYMPRWLDRAVPAVSIEGVHYFEELDSPVLAD